jgi:hypothetical protein
MRTTVATSLMFITLGYGNDRRVYISGGARVPTYGQQRPPGGSYWTAGCILSPT